jgi:hypothetical protein
MPIPAMVVAAVVATAGAVVATIGIAAQSSSESISAPQFSHTADFLCHKYFRSCLPQLLYHMAWIRHFVLGCVLQEELLNPRFPINSVISRTHFEMAAAGTVVDILLGERMYGVFQVLYSVQWCEEHGGVPKGLGVMI